MTENVIDLTGFTLLDVYGLEHIDVSGNFSEEKLAQLFIDEWIPYYECHKCSRVDYCKYPQPVSPGSYRMMDIQCGVVVAGIKNFVRSIFPLLKELDKVALQGILDGAHYLTRFLFDTEIKIGSAMDSAYIDYLEDFAPAFFGRIAHLRDHLNNMSSAFQHVPILQAKRGVLFVQGESEQAFVERLKLSRLAWFLNVYVDSYRGDGSRRLPRIEMLLERFNSQGYKIFIQGDADGGESSIFTNLIQRGLVEVENTFTFEYDFETAVPDKLAYDALREMELLSDVSFEQYLIGVGQRDKSLAPRLFSAFGIDINSIKIQFAQTVADIINWSQWTWWNDDEFTESELGKFLFFIRSVNY
ncbi:MAG: hypothetical protein AB1345_08565 [Chloroflexota bacterium]